MNRPRWIVLIVSVVIGIIAVMWFVVTLMTRTAEANALLAAEQADSVSEEVVETAQNQALSEISEEATGISQSKIDEDAEVIKGLAKLIYSWSTGDEYRENRQELIDTYGISENSALLTNFMPPLVASTDSDGGVVDEVSELKLHSEFVSLEPYVVGITDDGYDYYCIVTSSSSDSNGATAEGESALACHVDTDGNISNVTATTFIG